MDKRVIVVAGVAGAGLLGYYLLSKGNTLQGLMGTQAEPGWSEESAAPIIYQIPPEAAVNFPQPQPLPPFEEVFPMDDLSGILADIVEPTKKEAAVGTVLAPSSNEAKKTSIGVPLLDTLFEGILSGFAGPQVGGFVYEKSVQAGQWLGQKIQSAVSTSASNWLAGRDDSLLSGLNALLTGFVPGYAVAAPAAKYALGQLSPEKKNNPVTGPTATAVTVDYVVSPSVDYVVSPSVGQFGEPVYVQKKSSGGGHNSSTYTPSAAASKAVASSVSKFGGTVSHTVKTGTASVSYWSTKK